MQYEPIYSDFAEEREKNYHAVLTYVTEALAEVGYTPDGKALNGSMPDACTHYEEIDCRLFRPVILQCEDPQLFGVESESGGFVPFANAGNTYTAGYHFHLFRVQNGKILYHYGYMNAMYRDHLFQIQPPPPPKDDKFVEKGDFKGHRTQRDIPPETRITDAVFDPGNTAIRAKNLETVRRYVTARGICQTERWKLLHPHAVAFRNTVSQEEFKTVCQELDPSALRFGFVTNMLFHGADPNHVVVDSYATFDVYHPAQYEQEMRHYLTFFTLENGLIKNIYEIANPGMTLDQEEMLRQEEIRLGYAK